MCVSVKQNRNYYVRGDRFFSVATLTTLLTAHSCDAGAAQHYRTRLACN